MRLLRISGYVFVLLLVLTAVVIGLGSRLPAAHTAMTSVVLNAPQERIWGLITDVQSQPSWRSGLKSVEMLAPEGGGACWREVQSAMSMPLCVTASEAPRMRVVRISDPKLPFGGTWTYELEPAGQGAAGSGSTRLTITERGTTGPAMWRFAGHYLMGEDSNIKRYVGDLERAVTSGRQG